MNSVFFANFAATTGLTSKTVGSATLVAGGGDTFVSTDTSVGSVSSPFSSLSAAYQPLVRSAASTSATASGMTLTLGGLTNGTPYQVQVWANDSTGSLSGNAALNPKTIFTAGNTVTLDDNNLNAAGGLGQWVTGTFTADATSQNITITPDAGHLPVLNAFQLRVVPEPATLGLLLSGLGSALAARRRKGRPPLATPGK